MATIAWAGVGPRLGPLTAAGDGPAGTLRSSRSSVSGREDLRHAAHPPQLEPVERRGPAALLHPRAERAGGHGPGAGDGAPPEAGYRRARPALRVQGQFR